MLLLRCVCDSGDIGQVAELAGVQNTAPMIPQNQKATVMRRSMIFEVQVNAGSIFDNILICDSFDHAKSVAESLRKVIDKEGSDMVRADCQEERIFESLAQSNVSSSNI